MNNQSADVAIVGGGVATTATAIALLTSGIRPHLLVRLSRSIRMTEAIPAAAMQLFQALGLSDLAVRIGMRGRGLDNRWDPRNPTLHENAFTLVDRTELAQALLDEAQRRGAIVEHLDGPPVINRGNRSVTIGAAGSVRRFDAAIDASGRAAIWSRPVKQVRHLIAEIFAASGSDSASALTLTRVDAGWAYRIGLRNHATVAILAPARPRQSAFPDQLALELQIPTTGIRRIGRRVAFVQWATRVVEDRVLAVGDAALAHDPVSGQGIRFALASALAAAAVIRTWRRSDLDDALAAQFYSEFVATERIRHCGFLQSLYGGQFDFKDALDQRPSAATRFAAAPLSTTSDALGFAATVEAAPLHVNGFIERGEVIRLRDGGAVRWLDGFDLLRLRDWAGHEIAVPRLIELMVAEGMPSDKARAIVQWCCGKRILAGRQTGTTERIP